MPYTLFGITLSMKSKKVHLYHDQELDSNHTKSPIMMGPSCVPLPLKNPMVPLLLSTPPYNQQNHLQNCKNQLFFNLLLQPTNTSLNFPR